jgi:hypothetical protein
MLHRQVGERVVKPVKSAREADPVNVVRLFAGDSTKLADNGIAQLVEELEAAPGFERMRRLFGR